MSNQCSTLLTFRSFSFSTPFLTPLKPYAITLRPFFPLQQSLVLIRRRSRSRSSSSLLTLAAQSSSDIVLIATKEHGDGSLVFRFGDASEVVKNDGAVEEIESQTEQESSVVKVLDGDQDRQVMTQTDDRGYDSIDGGLSEVADGIRSADIVSDIAESETNAIGDLIDFRAESSEKLSDISEKEVILSQSDPKMNNSLAVTESTLDETKLSAQLDGQENSDLDVARLDGSDDKTASPSVSVELEIKQVSKIEVVDDLDKVETGDNLEIDPETPSLVPATIHATDIGLTEAANVDVEEEVKDVIFDEGTVIDELPPSNPLDVQSVDAANEDVEDELQEMTIIDNTIIDEIPSSDHLVEPTVSEGSQLQLVNVRDQTIEDELPQNDAAFVMPVSHTEEAEKVVEEEVFQPESTPPELKPAIQVNNDIKDPSGYVDLEVIDAPQSYADDKSLIMESKDTSEGDTKDLLPPATLHVPDVVINERLEDMNISESAFADETPASYQLGIESILEVSTAKCMDLKDADMDERLQEISISKGAFTDDMPASDPFGTESVLEASTAESMDVKGVTMDERFQDINISEGAFTDEMPASDPIGTESVLEVSTANSMDVKDADMDESLQDINISVGAFTDEMLSSDQLRTESVVEVPTTKSMDVKDVDMDERLQDTNIGEGGFTDEMPASDPLGTESVLEVPIANSMDVKDADMDERLQDMNITEGTIIDEMPKSDPLVAEPTSEVSTIKGMGIDVKDLAVEDDLQLVSNDKMNDTEIADVMPAEPVLEEEVSQADLMPVELKAARQASGIKFEDAIGQNLDDEVSPVIDEDAGDSYIEDVEQSFIQLESQPVQVDGVNHDILQQGAKSLADESSTMLEQEGMDAMVGSSELTQASDVTALMSAAKSEVQREEINLTDNFLLSGAALLEHPSKALTGGDDAYFVAGSKWLGVANGVSQWSFEGTDPGVYAQELMRTCEEIVLDASITSPVELLCRGVKETSMSGSSSVLIANFDGQQALHVANIGDTGFLIMRHGAIYKKSSPLLHEFHFALQVDDSDDPLQLVDEYLIELEVGDIIVIATDGLFDNLYEREITMIVSKSLQAGMKPQEIAKILATRAQEVGKSEFVRSPFSDAAQAAGYTGYTGGKTDNVAVIVSVVEKGSNLVEV